MKDKLVTLGMSLVSKGLPEVKEVDDYRTSAPLLCVAHGSYHILQYNEGDEEGGWSTWYCPAFEDEVEGVTHWQYLYELPTGEEF
jgi:hypothetical protein